MERKTKVKIPFLIALIFIVQITSAQINNQDTIISVKTIGVFEGKIATVGNFNAENVYKINEYCIAITDISTNLADSLKGKKILVTGELKIVVGKTFPAKTSTDGTIYEPYIEPDRKFISRPVFTIMQ